MKTLLFVIGLCSLIALAPAVPEQAVKTFRTRDVVMYYTAEDENGIKDRVLWFTIDDGATWGKAAPAIVEWKSDDRGRTFAIFHAPADGSYGFTFQFVDNAGIPTPAPQPGDRPELVAVIATGPEILRLEDVLESPVRESAVESKSRSIKIPYRLKKSLSASTRILWATADGGATWAKVPDAEWVEGAGATAVLLTTGKDGTFGFTMELGDGKTYSTPAPRPGEKPYFTATVTTTLPVVSIGEVLVEPVKGGEIRSTKREIRTSYRLKEGYAPTDRRLWLTSDGGKSWKNEERVEWLFDGKGNGFALFSVPADGAYGVTFEFNNPEKFAMAAPRAGDAPRFVVIVDTTQPILNLADLLESPKAGENFTSASWSVRIPYQLKAGAAVATKDLLVTADGGKSWDVAENVEWSSDREGKTFVRFAVPADGTYGVTFRMTDASGLATAAPKEPLASVAVTTVKVQARGKPVLLKPTGGEQWTGGKVVVLQWMSTNGVRDKSTAISYSIDGGEWVVITKGQENMGFYRWAPPSKATRHLKIRVTMEDAAGAEIASEPSGDITIAVPANPDIAAAKRHFHRATLLRAQRKYDEAIMSYEEALAAWDQYPDALNDIAYVHYQIGDYGKALEYFLRAREVNRGAAQSNAYVGFALFKLGLPEDSLRELTNAVALDATTRALGRDVADELMELAGVFRKSGNTEAAAKACALILQIPSARAETRRMAQSLTAPQ